MRHNSFEMNIKTTATLTDLIHARWGGKSPLRLYDHNYNGFH